VTYLTVFKTSTALMHLVLSPHGCGLLLVSGVLLPYDNRNSDILVACESTQSDQLPFK
jgi:hypothetical protein